MEKAQHAPGCFVGDGAIGEREDDGIKGDEPDQPKVRIAHVPACEGDHHSRTGQNQDQPFAPNWPVVLMKEGKSLEIKTKVVDVSRVSARAMEPGHEAAHRVQWTI